MPCHQSDYPQGRFLAVEINMATGAHQLLNTQSLPQSECYTLCQQRGPSPSNIHRQLLLAHKDPGE